MFGVVLWCVVMRLVCYEFVCSLGVILCVVVFGVVLCCVVCCGVVMSCFGFDLSMMFVYVDLSLL